MMDKVELGVALIRKTERQVKWLGRFNIARQQIEFITGQRLANESLRETVSREVAWELDIDRRKDFVVSSMAQLNINFETQLPGQVETTQLAAAFYNVEFYRTAALEKTNGNDDTVWLTSAEICNGVTEAGLVLDPLFVSLNKEAKVIQHWESDVTGEG